MYTKDMIQKKCEVCGGEFASYPSQKRRYCGQTCKINSQHKPVHRVCLTCRTPFTTNPSRNKRYCNDECARAGEGTFEHRKCLSCGTPFTTYTSQNKQYCSQKCKGVARRKPDSTLSQIRRNAYVPQGHPLAPPGRRQVIKHRLILWESIGAGPHPCYHCGDLVDWIPGNYTKKGSLVVDHLDRNPLNNELDNLKPSCQRCNKMNSDRTVLDEEDYRLDSNGIRKRGKRLNCELCGTSFVAWHTTSRFCRLSCARKSYWR